MTYFWISDPFRLMTEVELSSGIKRRFLITYERTFIDSWECFQKRFIDFKVVFTKIKNKVRTLPGKILDSSRYDWFSFCDTAFRSRSSTLPNLMSFTRINFDFSAVFQQKSVVFHFCTFIQIHQKWQNLIPFFWDDGLSTLWKKNLHCEWIRNDRSVFLRFVHLQS